MDRTERFATERPRLVAIAARVLGDPIEAEDVAQQAWLRLHCAEASIENLPGWLTTVTVRLCLDRLKARTPVPVDEVVLPTSAPDPADDVALVDSVAAALRVVLDRLTPGERVAFMLHDSFGFEFASIAALLGTTPAAARKLASRARAKLAPLAAAPSAAPSAGPSTPDRVADWDVVDAFLAAARLGQFDRLVRLLAPDALITGDFTAAAIGTPTLIEGRTAVATFFDGAASAALPVFVGDRPGAAWFDRGKVRVVFDFRIEGGLILKIELRGDPDVLSHVRRRRRGTRQ